nr:hypothetical protein [Tanacetum cinerariifolium]
MSMTIQPSIKEKLLAAQNEAIKEQNVSTEMMRSLDQQMESKGDRALYFMDRIWVPLIGDVRIMIMSEAHVTRYSIYPGANKMYYDFRDMYWWSSMKKYIATYDRITMDFITKWPRSSSGYDTIWVIVDRLTKSAHFLATREDYSMEKLSRIYIDETVARHETLEDMLRAWVIDFGSSWDTHLPLAEFSYNKRENRLIGPEMVQETTDKVAFVETRRGVE